MDKLLLRGYVTPEDCGGDVQAALDLAEKLDIRKVILEKDYTCLEAITVPAYTHLINRGTLTARLQCKKNTGYCFEQDRFFFQGGKLVGDLYFFNSRRVIMEDVQVQGNITYEYSRDMRMERCRVTGNINVGRGCANAIFQNLTVGSFYISNEVFCGDIVPAKEPDIKNIVLRDSRVTDGSVYLVAQEDCGMFNIQADHITASEKAVVIGKEGQTLPKERYFNLTFEALDAPEKLVCHNETKHTYTNI